MTIHCPQCQKTISSQAIACPHCQTSLKALGHQGIPLHQAAGEAILCTTCLYHQDNSCNYPQRPLAKSCILYVDVNVPLEPVVPDQAASRTGWVTQWIRDHLAMIIIIGLGVLSVLIVLSGG